MRVRTCRTALLRRGGPHGRHLPLAGAPRPRLRRRHRRPAPRPDRGTEPAVVRRRRLPHRRLGRPPPRRRERLRVPRMRQICHLHLTRFVGILLDRKDRVSMAVGLEVRVPFCDHRLVDYGYNAPWALKSFAGREKSPLREATADVIPTSVYDRAKSPYPSTQDPAHGSALQVQAKDLLARPGHPVFDLVDRERLRQAAHREAPVYTQAARRGLERALDLAQWIDLLEPDITLT
ncbi:asparagine synthase-related protein [Streptomyces sp. TRM68367]|uniref:asparagine synthase-related protein n=1 Tax=Streptomyces sp. TRM68367 TaxID=2758415 RepID=UPI00165A8F65|nr:asparagine synthase-related protein [Streptomyces sp. TRM68367]MBC9727951.1 hypothetical protein [Streptomyces sp. TRM68367]